MSSFSSFNDAVHDCVTWSILIFSLKQHIEKNELSDILTPDELKDTRAKAEQALANETMDDRPILPGDDNSTDQSANGKLLITFCTLPIPVCTLPIPVCTLPIPVCKLLILVCMLLIPVCTLPIPVCTLLIPVCTLPIPVCKLPIPVCMLLIASRVAEICCL